MSHVSAAAFPPAAAPGPNQCELSVVVGSVNSGRSIVSALTSLTEACRGLVAEIIVVDASTDDTVARIRACGADIRLRQLPAGSLTPTLWSTGFTMSRGRVVAFTTGHCIVGENWARALLRGIENGASGVAGSLSLAVESDPVDWALFYLRYSAFIAAGERETQMAHEIPGDNAAYRREALERHAGSFGNGFWEVDFHRRLRAEDAATRLEFVPGAGARFGPSTSLGALIRQRFAHGCHSGGWRVETAVRPAWHIVLAAPLVPSVLVLRIARRVWHLPGHRARFLYALPALLALAFAWAAGEAWGALSHPVTETIRKPRLAA